MLECLSVDLILCLGSYLTWIGGCQAPASLKSRELFQA